MAYAFYRSITIAAAQLGSTSLTNFTVRFQGTFSYLATIAQGGNVQNSSGFDICFFADSALTTKLDFERVSYSNTGAVEFWISIPSVDHASDTTFYLAYGDSGILVSQATGSAAWDGSYLAVYHLDGFTPSNIDSSVNGKDLAFTRVSAAAGVVTGGAAFASGGGGSMGTIDAGLLVNQQSVTLSCWVKSSTTSDQIILDMGWLGGGGSGVIIHSGSDNAGSFAASHGTGNLATTGVAVADGAWHHVAFVYDGTNNGGVGVYLCYVDGVLVQTTTAGIDFLPFGPGTSNNNIRLGRGDSGFDLYFNGTIDEARFSTAATGALAARSASWLKAEFNNQKASSTFLTIGSEIGATASAAAYNNAFMTLLGHH